MLDPVAVLLIRMRGIRRLVSGDQLFNRTVPNRMAGHLIALADIVLHQLIQLRIRQDLHAGLVVIAQIGLPHSGGAPARRSIQKNLDRTDAQHVVAHA